MSLAEKLKEEGRAEGRKEGRKEGREEVLFEMARIMLIEGCDPVFVAKVLKLPINKIEELKKSL